MGSHPDVWLWISLAALSYYAAMTVHRQLVIIREASKITQQDEPSEVLNQQTENAIKVETLGHLTQSPSLEIRNASVNILTERAIQDDLAWKFMLRDISDSDAETRDRALTCVCSLMSSAGKYENARAIFRSTEFVTAMVDCLCNLIPEACTAEGRSADESTYRIQAEHDALDLLRQHFPSKSQRAVEAGLISRWLINYPFGGPNSPLHRKRQVMKDIVERSSKYKDEAFGYSMERVLARVLQVDGYRAELVRYGLIDLSDPAFSACASEDSSDLEIFEARIHAACFPPAAWLHGGQAAEMDWIPEASEGSERASANHAIVPPANRPREESIEERALRRRRREAMVVGRNGQPIQNQDIIQRETVTLSEEVEEEFEEVMEVTREGQGGYGRDWWELLTRLRPHGLAPPP